MAGRRWQGGGLCAAGLVLAMAMGATRPYGAAAQSVDLEPAYDRGVMLEVRRPGFEDGLRVGPWSVAGMLSARWAVRPTLVLVGDLPFSIFDAEAGASASSFGNPYLGLRVTRLGAPLQLEAGFRFPMAASNAGGVSGFYADPDRFEAFLPDVAAVRAAGRYGVAHRSGLRAALRLSPALLVATGASGTADLYVSYGAQAGMRGGAVSGWVVLNGRSVVTRRALRYDERAEHAVGFRVRVEEGRWRPGLLLQLPLDEDVQQTIDYVLGVTLSVALDHR